MDDALWVYAECGKTRVLRKHTGKDQAYSIAVGALRRELKIPLRDWKPSITELLYLNGIYVLKQAPGGYIATKTENHVILLDMDPSMMSVNRLGEVISRYMEKKIEPNGKQYRVVAYCFPQMYSLERRQEKVPQVF